VPDNLPAVIPIDDFDLADEEQILHELAGRVTEKFLYPGDRGEQLLSYAGINWAVREYAKQGEVLRVVGDPIVRPDEDPEYVLAIVKAERVIVDPKTGHETHLDSCFGAKRKWKKQLLKDKATAVPDPSYWEKAISMAERNAKRKLMPVDFVQRMVAIALGKKNKPAEAQKPAAKPATATPAPAKPPAPTPAAAPAPPPAQTQTAPPAAPAPAPATAPSSAPTQASTGTPTMGNRVYVALARVEAKVPAFKGKKKGIFAALMGVDSTTKISTADAEALIEAVNLCTCVPAIHEIREANGSYQMVTLPDGAVIYPKAPAPAAASPDEPEGMF